MDNNMIQNGTMGRWMMRNTASVQINFDFTSEQELNEIVFIADCINPISAYLFSNSPFMEGEKIKDKNLRNIIWENTDNIRCRNLIDHNIIKKCIITISVNKRISRIRLSRNQRWNLILRMRQRRYWKQKLL